MLVLETGVNSVQSDEQDQVLRAHAVSAKCKTIIAQKHV
jgi:hypothetical protein